MCSINIPAEYKGIYKVLENEPLHINEICKKLNKPINNINSNLTLMEIEGLIEQLPGNMFKIVEETKCIKDI